MRARIFNLRFIRLNNINYLDFIDRVINFLRKQNERFLILFFKTLI